MLPKKTPLWQAMLAGVLFASVLYAGVASVLYFWEKTRPAPPAATIPTSSSSYRPRPAPEPIKPEDDPYPFYCAKLRDYLKARHPRYMIVRWGVGDAIKGDGPDAGLFALGVWWREPGSLTISECYVFERDGSIKTLLEHGAAPP